MLWAVVLCVASTLLLWLWYWAFTALLRSTRPTFREAGDYLRIAGLPLDILYNWLVGSLVFLEAPAELTFSRRLQRHIDVRPDAVTWRYTVALMVCRVFIWPIDRDHLTGDFL